MDKLVEREAAARTPLSTAPAVAVQFFLIPLLVVGATVLVYVGFRSLLTDDRSAEEYLVDIRSGGTNRRWPAAYELSRMMSDPGFVKSQEAVLAPELTQAFADSKNDDPRVRQYLALTLGRLTPPIPLEARTLLIEALHDQDSQTRISAIWALGSTGDATAVADIQRAYLSEDAGVRKMVVYALGSIPGDASVQALLEALDDIEADVQWNAAMALARHGRHESAGVLRRMLDREYVARNVTRQQQAQDEIDPVSEVIMNGLRAIASLKETSLLELVKAVSVDDPNIKVRQAALQTLKTLG